MFNHDTICAIATAMTNSGIGIIRVSGNDAIEKVDNIFTGKEKLVHAKSHTVHYGHIVCDDTIIDEVMVLVFRAPRSYTTEDTVEIDCHGGVIVMQQIVKLMIAQGIRPAEPGEFTKRAFLNGRIDLSQAESVMDVIDSKSKLALKNSMMQLQGKLSKQIKSLRDQIIYEIAYIESALDDPEHISLDGYQERLLKKINLLREQIKQYMDSSNNGIILKEGIQTVIIGKPNVGKSSLLNVLTRKERAIVTDIAGTTRDILEEQIQLNGINLNIIDTAGIRDTEDVVEQIGVNKALNTLVNADLILYIIDASIPLDTNDFQIMDKIKDRRVIALLNKSDLNTVVNENDIKNYFDCEVLSFSTKNGSGLHHLENLIEKMVFHGAIQENDEIFITNMRHLTALTNAYDNLCHVAKSIENKMPEDFLSIDLMAAYENLGTIIGESVEEDLINEIFAKFCTGK